MKSWKQGVSIFLLIVAPVAVYLLWPSDEARIRKLVKLEAQAIEAEDIQAVMKGISYNYSDDKGLSYLLIKRIMEREFARLNNIKFSYSDLHIVVRDDDTATAVMDLHVTAGGTEAAPRYVLGDSETPVVLNLALKKEGTGKWTIRSSSWPPAF
ncbi:MAG: hypothetical protein KAR83_09570 [Thermodesulfovibrionales bacterium]|nr:hypothetical protein [Thermodesulfovibrionales bacterium]